MTAVETRNRALCAAWLAWLGKRSSPSTLDQYGRKAELLCEWSGERPLGSLSLADMEAFVARERRYGVVAAAATKNLEINILRNLYRWANARGHLSSNPTAEMRVETAKNHNPKAIPVASWPLVWDAELPDDMRSVLGLGFFCGLRREEMCRLQAKHFVGDQILHFPRKGDRNDQQSGVLPFVSCARLFAERKPALLAVPEHFLDPLWRVVASARQVGGDDGWVLPWAGAMRHRPEPRRRTALPPGSTPPDMVNKRLASVLNSLGLSRGLFTPHALRHSFVTYLLQMGVPLVSVSVLANHSSVAITQRYVKIAEDPLAEFLGQPLRGSVGWG